MKRRELLTVGLAGFFASACRTVGAAQKPQAELPPARDFHADANALGKQPRLVVVLFSIPDCPYCEQIRREQLLPLVRDRGLADSLVVREVSIGGARTLVDFQGVPTTEAAFAREAQAKFSPTVAFFAPTGNQVAPAIVGARLPDFYGAYLDDAIHTGIAKIRDRA